MRIDWSIYLFYISMWDQFLALMSDNLFHMLLFSRALFQYFPKEKL